MKLLFVKYTLKIIWYNMDCTFSIVKKKKKPNLKQIWIFSNPNLKQIKYNLACTVAHNERFLCIKICLMTSEIFCLLKNTKIGEGHLK